LEGNSFFCGVFFLMEKMVVYSPLTNGIVVVFGHYAQGGLGRGRGESHFVSAGGIIFASKD
jgi:hypothetical protein